MCCQIKGNAETLLASFDVVLVELVALLDSTEASILNKIIKSCLYIYKTVQIQLV